MRLRLAAPTVVLNSISKELTSDVFFGPLFHSVQEHRDAVAPWLGPLSATVSPAEHAGMLTRVDEEIEQAMDIGVIVDPRLAGIHRSTSGGASSSSLPRRTDCPDKRRRTQPKRGSKA
jgi:hypothetical protein